jgi:hypothetical protein
VGLETFAGEIVAARVTGLDAIVTSLDDVAVALSFDVRAGVTLVGSGGSSGDASRTARPRPAPPPVAPPAPKREPAWTQAIDASSHAEPPRAMRMTENAPMPQRPLRPPTVDEGDQPIPEAGDVVEHFAFGRCEVLKAEGDRLHLRVGKDARVREIALEMLRVVEQPTEGPRRRFKLERKM